MKNFIGVRQKRAWTVFAAVSLILGVALLLQGSYIQLKAQLAQHLMGNAWQQTLQTGYPRAPWPWADTEVIGKIQYRDNEHYILSGESLRNLAFGPALMATTSPLNHQGNAVIVGHRDTHFSDIQYLEMGDIIVVKSTFGVREYTVSERAIIRNTDVGVLAPTAAPALTLISCYPFNSVLADPALRYVIRALANSR